MVLAIVLIGSLLAAVTWSLALLIVARVLQGVSFALYPIGVAVLREEFAQEAGVRDLGVVGDPGLRRWHGPGGDRAADGWGRRVSPRVLADDGVHIVAVAIVVAVVPARARSSTETIDWLCAAGLAVGLSAILLAITQGNTWGWTSPATLGCGSGRRRRNWPAGGGGNDGPNSRWCRHRCLPGVPSLFTNLATVFVGMGLYFAFLGLTQFVQIPRERAGYGFSATVLEASVVYLLPGAVTGFLIALVSGRFIDRYWRGRSSWSRRYRASPDSCSSHLRIRAAWQVIVASILANGYIALGYGALPALVVSEVDAGETGVATSMNAIAGR